MPETHSQAGKEVEQMTVTDEPHDKYRGHDPWTGEKLDNGYPMLITVPGGKIIRKDVTYYTIKCPNCRIPAKYTHDSEPVCPDCGIVCAGRDTIRSEQIVRDAKAAGRIDEHGAKN